MPYPLTMVTLLLKNGHVPKLNISYTFQRQSMVEQGMHMDFLTTKR